MDDGREAAQVLCRAAWRVRRGWTTGCLARDADGRPCDPRNPGALAWCLEGALAAEAGSEVAAIDVLGWLSVLVDMSRAELRAWQDEQAVDEEAVARLLELGGYLAERTCGAVVR